LDSSVENFGLLFPAVKVLTKNGLGYILGGFITNPSGHPDRLLPVYQQLEQWIIRNNRLGNPLVEDVGLCTLIRKCVVLAVYWLIPPNNKKSYLDERNGYEIMTQKMFCTESI
jgi:hypothetical protein